MTVYDITTGPDDSQALRSATVAALASMPIGHGIIPSRSGTAATAKAIATAALEISQGATQHLPAVKNLSSSDLTDDANGRMRELAQSSITAHVQKSAAALSTAVQAARAEAQADAAKHKPVLNPNDVGQLTRTDQAWRNNILPMLAAGKQWNEIVQFLDQDGILALQRFAPTHVALTEDADVVPEVVSLIGQLSEDRLIALAPEGGPREALQAERDTNRYAETAERTLGLLGTVHDAQSAMDIAIAIKRATFAAGANPEPVAPAGEESVVAESAE